MLIKLGIQYFVIKFYLREGEKEEGREEGREGGMLGRKGGR